jgi:uncharacterized protein (DUF58 family)
MNPVKLFKKMLAWLETHGAVPAYGGWVLLGLTLCFWLAAANTMAGWLYVLSGLGAALLLLSALLPMQLLRGVEITRSPLYPIHAGESLTIALHLWNRTAQSKGLLVVQDQIPTALGEMTQTAVEAIAPQSSYIWHYCLKPQHRGLYLWQTVVLRTGAPLGLFWSRRLHSVPTKVLVYPRVLPLLRCPLLDEVGPSARQIQLQQVPVSQQGQEGSTRSLRPYRTGDPMRLVHWRSSARYSELRIRELERFNGGQTFVIALDLMQTWHPDHFEQAVMAAASLYLYALQHHGAALFWTASTGTLQSKPLILETLAQVQPQAVSDLPQQPIIWLTANPGSISQLPLGSRYVLWPSGQPSDQGVGAQEGLQTVGADRLPESLGIIVNSEHPLQVQLQSTLCKG